MNLSQTQYCYFLGIGGIGMSALARYFNALGKVVSGYDKTPSRLTSELEKEGINVHYDENPEMIRTRISSGEWTKENLLVVYTPAVPKSHSEYVLFIGLGLNINKRSEVLGMLTAHSMTIAVAGTHGKTTTSSLITHILINAGMDCSAFLGGITKNYHTNFILGKTLQLKAEDSQQLSAAGQPVRNTIVVEADEYDRSFLSLHPSISVITSLDADHLDIYGNKDQMDKSYSQFASQLQPGGKLIINKSVEDQLSYIGLYLSYSVTKMADFRAINISIENGIYTYDIATPAGVLEKVSLGLPGLHNVENSLAAVAVAYHMNVPEKFIRKALTSFEGVQRRFDYQLKSGKIIFIDDYAHHPEELRACISSVKQIYPGRKLTGIFQPHLFSRTRDFAEGFSQSLDLLDECILLDIYPARELPIEGVSSGMLLNKMKSKNKMVCPRENLINELKSRKLEIVLTLGAGDIDMLVNPIKEFLMKEYGD